MKLSTYVMIFPNRQCMQSIFNRLRAQCLVSHLIPYFKRHIIQEGINACNNILLKVYENRAESFSDLIAMLNLVQDEKERNYLNNISAEEYVASFMPQEVPEDGWQKSSIHVQKLIEAGEILNDYLPFLKEIKRPSLLLVGKFDPACGKDQRDYFKNNVPNGKISLLEKSGHFARIEEPEAYTQAILNFMNSTIYN